ncbi:17984_t:CDS:2 [Dentiscutata erythropus]|uniref:17984_t:CDS:1 n=1 Tax=Dentiscutata erythropus TaxID=1348616 RepID=A0A9N8V7I5_9GLOM|nr:17984_t:CDS:2 [Dentiscutata erythropus]
MESEEDNIFLDENYIVENNYSEIIDDNTSDNISSNQERDEINSINEDNISENEANISQANEENVDMDTDDKSNFKSIVHQHFTLDKKIKKYKCNYCSSKYKIPKDKSTSALKRHLEKKHKNMITNEKITGAMDKFVKKEELKIGIMI